MTRLAWTLLALWCLSGCYSTSLLQDARVLPARSLRMAFAGGVAGSQTMREPDLEVGLRVGVSEGIELQGKLTLGGLEGAAKFALLDDAGPFYISLLPGVQLGSAIGDNNLSGQLTRRIGGVHLTPLFGFELAQVLGLIVAPDAQVGLRSDNAGPKGWVGFGGRVALALHVSETTTLIPECSVLAITFGPRDEIERENLVTRTFREFSRGDLRFQCMLGVSFGSAYAPRAS